MQHLHLIWVSKLEELERQNLYFLKTEIAIGTSSSNFSVSCPRETLLNYVQHRGGLLRESNDCSDDQSPERQQPQKSIEIQKPRLSRVQLPS
jgi:hypothetical protein